MGRSWLLALLLAAPLAAASEPTAPWEFEEARIDGTGAVGEAIDVLLRVRANSDVSGRIVLRAPEWVVVEGEPWEMSASAGATEEREWRLVPTQEGFWAAIASAEDEGFGAACACVLGFAGGAPEARVATTPEGALPVPLLERSLSAIAQDDGSVRLERSVTPVASWLAHAEIHVWITPGSTYLCDACAMSLPEPAHEARAPGRDTVVASATLALQEGDAFTLWDEVVARFAAPEGATLEPVATVRTGCENRRWGTEESWPCDEASDEWAHMLPLGERLRRGVPAPLPLLALAAAALLVARGRRG